jgi:hypothetical protein
LIAARDIIPEEQAVLIHILQSALGIGVDLALAFPALLLAQKQSRRELIRLQRSRRTIRSARK